MQPIHHSKLPVNEILSQNLYHATGALLFQSGQRLGPEHVCAPLMSDVKSVFIADSIDEALSIERQALEPRPVEALILNAPLEQDICDANGLVLLRRGHLFHSDHLRLLLQRGIEQIWVYHDKARSWVKLSSSAITRVIGANTGPKMDRLHVMMMSDHTGIALSEPLLVNLADHPDIKVVQALPPPNVDDEILTGF